MDVIIFENDKVSVLTIAPGVDKDRAISKALAQVNNARHREVDHLPDVSVDAMFWSEDDGGKVVVRAEHIPLDWAGLMADFMALDTDMKMKLSHDYPSITQALIERDEEYLLRLIVSRETSLSDKDRDAIRSILVLHNVDLNKWVNEIPF